MWWHQVFNGTIENISMIFTVKEKDYTPEPSHPYHPPLDKGRDDGLIEWWARERGKNPDERTCNNIDCLGLF